MRINDKLRHEVLKMGFHTCSRENLRVTFEYRAREEADSLHARYRAFLARHIGHNDFEISNVMCMAKGITGHVYVGDKGTGFQPKQRRCLFCDCPDDD